MSLLDTINAQIAENAIEAEHEGTINELKKKHRSLGFHQLKDKIVDRTDLKHDGVVIIFSDGTYVRGLYEKDYDGMRDFDSWDLSLEEVDELGLMSVEDKEKYDAAQAYYAERARQTEEARLVHRVKSQFSAERLKQLFGAS